MVERDQSSPVITSLCKDVDVAIIGNGPSGLFLSYLLSGWRPYFTGEHPDQLLASKLDPRLSLLDQDLHDLSEGLEGRSLNQLSLLMDTLLLPNTDIGEEHPSALDWRYEPAAHVSHVVIGESPAGGSWHDMAGEVKSLSLASWLQLPGYSFHDWALARGTNGDTAGHGDRVSLGQMAQYYTNYVAKMGLEENIMAGVQVTKVKECPPPVKCSVGSPKPCSCSSSPSPVSVSSCLPGFFHTVDSGLALCEANSFSTESYDSCSDSEDIGISCGQNNSYKWRVKASGRGQTVAIRARNLVLACGVSKPKHLQVIGENNSFVVHKFSDFYQKLDSLNKDLSVVVVGAGLSAADAVLLAIKKGLKVLHIFSQDPHDPSLVYNKMNHPLYSEYRTILMLMKGETHNPLYTPAPQSSVSQFTDHGQCIYQDSRGEEISVPVSLVGIFIGSEADLGFLPKRIRSTLAVDPELPVNAKSNPVDVDPLTFESEACPTLYALGPLVGDHFVRFVLGSGLGACKNLVSTHS